MSEEEKAIKRLEEITKDCSLNSEDLHYANILYYLIINLQQENKALKEKINGVYEERDYLYNKTTTESKYIIQQLKNRINKVIEYIEKYDVFKEYSFPLMKRDEENQIKSSIKYEFDTSIKKDLLKILKGDKE